MAYKISVESKHDSRAKLWGRRTKKILLGAPYEVMLKMKNVGEEDFPSGVATINIRYTSIISHVNRLPVPKIDRGKEAPPVKIKRSALGKGYASFFGKIEAKDGKPVQLIAHRQVLPENASFYDIFIESRTDVYSYWMLIISAASLVALVIFSFLRFIL